MMHYNDISQFSKLELEALVTAVNTRECAVLQTNLKIIDLDDTAEIAEEKAILAAGFNTVVEVSAFRIFKEAKDVMLWIESDCKKYRIQVDDVQEKIHTAYKKYMTAKYMLQFSITNVQDTDEAYIMNYLLDDKNNNLHSRVKAEYLEYKNVLVSYISEKRKLEARREELYQKLRRQTKYINIIYNTWLRELRMLEAKAV